MPAVLGRQDGDQGCRAPASANKGAPISTSVKAFALLLAVIGAAIGLHRFSPVHWPPLAVDILHSLHGTGFAALAMAILWYLQRRFPDSNNYLVAAGITMGIGVISEAAQIPGPRDAQFSDLVVDGLGVFGAIGLVAAFDGSVRGQLRRGLRMMLPALAATALTIACAPSFWLTYALVQQNQAFPELVTFEHAWERATFGQTADTRPMLVAAPADWPTEGDTVAHSVENGRWGIFISIHPIPDWRGYSSLSFVAASKGQSFALDIGVRDMRKDGEYHGVAYYKSVFVTPEPQRIIVSFDEISAADTGRPLDFSLVESIVLSTADPGNGTELLSDDFRLRP